MFRNYKSVLIFLKGVRTKVWKKKFKKCIVFLIHASKNPKMLHTLNSLEVITLFSTHPTESNQTTPHHTTPHHTTPHHTTPYHTTQHHTIPHHTTPHHTTPHHTTQHHTTPHHTTPHHTTPHHTTPHHTTPHHTTPHHTTFPHTTPTIQPANQSTNQPQNQSLSEGIPPPDLTGFGLPSLGPIKYDMKSGQKFGEVLENVGSLYQPGEVAKCSFRAGNPRNVMAVKICCLNFKKLFLLNFFKIKLFLLIFWKLSKYL